MSRRIADLESLILTSQGRERAPVLLDSKFSSLTPPLRPSMEQKLGVPLSTSTMAKKPGSMDDSADDTSSPPAADHSLIDINSETHGVEYYGGSSSIAILDRLYKRARRQSSHQVQSTASQKPSVVNLLHNPEFNDLSPTAGRHSPDGSSHQGEPVSPRLIEGGFLTAFFDTLHYMHPVIDKNAFLDRCEKGSVDTENDFAALYYSCLALAAITSPEKDPKFSGFSPIQWANLFVDRAKNCRISEVYRLPVDLGDIFSITTVETVQSLLLLA
jgi:hypothetical protein